MHIIRPLCVSLILLFELICDKRWYPKPDDNWMDFNVVEYLEDISVHVDEYLLSCSHPTSFIASLMHWGIIHRLLELLDHKHCQWLLELNTTEPTSVSVCMWLSDSNFLYQMLKVFGAKCLEGTVENITIGADLPQFHLVIANYVHPNVWDEIQQVYPFVYLFSLLVSISIWLMFAKKSPGSSCHILNGIQIMWELRRLDEIILLAVVVRIIIQKGRRKIAPRQRLIFKSHFCKYCFPKLNT